MFSPDGKLVVSAFINTIVKLWGLSARIIIQTYKALPVINRLSFSKDELYFETDRRFLYFLSVFSHTYSFHQPTMIDINLQER